MVLPSTLRSSDKRVTSLRACIQDLDVNTHLRASYGGALSWSNGVVSTTPSAYGDANMTAIHMSEGEAGNLELRT
jgi:hypothetical protein